MFNAFVTSFKRKVTRIFKYFKNSDGRNKNKWSSKIFQDETIEWFSYLFESLQNFLTLTKVSEQEMQSSGNERGIIVHGKMQQDSEKSSTPLTIEIESSALVATTKNAFSLSANGFQINAFLSEINVARALFVFIEFLFENAE